MEKGKSRASVHNISTFYNLHVFSVQVFPTSDVVSMDLIILIGLLSKIWTPLEPMEIFTVHNLLQQRVLQVPYTSHEEPHLSEYGAQ